MKILRLTLLLLCIQATLYHVYGQAVFVGNAGSGRMFKASTDGTVYTKIFDNSSVSFFEQCAQGPDGYLYGTDYQESSLFRLKADGTGFTKIKLLTAAEGISPACRLLYLNGLWYGATGASTGNRGTLFSMNLDGTGYTECYTRSVAPKEEMQPGPYTKDPMVFFIA